MKVSTGMINASICSQVDGTDVSLRLIY